MIGVGAVVTGQPIVSACAGSIGRARVGGGVQPASRGRPPARVGVIEAFLARASDGAAALGDSGPGGDREDHRLAGGRRPRVRTGLAGARRAAGGR